MPTASPISHIFVDFENVHHVDAALFNSGSPVHLTLLVGAKQTKIETGLVEKLLAHASSVHWVRLASSGKNALDFTLAYYVGRAATLHPLAHFHIISKDTGFDPLIAHLQTLQIHIQRHNDYAALTGNPAPASKTTRTPKSPPASPRSPRTRSTRANTVAKDPYAHVLEHLRQHPRNRPKQEKSLAPHLRSVCGKGTTDAGVQALLTRLIKDRHITITEKGAITYSLA